MNFDLTGKRVLVSAGGSGIGRAIVEGFVAQGAKVVTCDINPDFVDDLKTALPNVMAQVVDVGDEPAVQAFCAAAIDHLGGLDCLVNNAGIAGPTLPVEEIDATDWNACLNICLNSQFYFPRPASHPYAKVGMHQSPTCPRRRANMGLPIAPPMRPQNGGDWPDKITGHRTWRRQNSCERHFAGAGCGGSAAQCFVRQSAKIGQVI